MKKLVNELEMRMREVAVDFNYNKMDKLYDDVMKAYNKYRDLDLDDEDLDDRLNDLYDQVEELQEIMYLMNCFRKNF